MRSCWICCKRSARPDPKTKSPLREQEGILYAELDPTQMRGPKWMLDVAGHYARPDVFQLSVNRASYAPIQTVSVSPEEFEPYELTGWGL